MAKNTSTNQEVVNETSTPVVENIYKMPEIMAQHGTPTLKAIAMVFDLNPVRLYHVAKTPKEGEIYDAKKYNWDAIERFCIKRFDPDKGINTLEDIITKALSLDQELQLSDKRRTTEAAGSSKLEQINVDGRMMPVRKFPNFDINYVPENGAAFAHPAGNHVIVLKRDSAVYGFIYQTRGFTVLRPVGQDGEFQNEVIKVISNSLLNLLGVGPTTLTAALIEEQYKAQAVEAKKLAEELAEQAAEAAAKVQ